MKTRWPVLPLLSSTLLTVLVAFGGFALAQGNGPAPAASASASPGLGAPTNSPLPAVLSPGIGEIIKMADAGVSTEVIKTYVQYSYSSTLRPPTDADLIALKQHKVSDEIATLLLKQSAQVRAAAAQVRVEALKRAWSARNAAAGGFDPESYNYFQYYYLQPRALASAYDRLYPYYYPFYPFANGYGPAFRTPYFH